jgi:hypothetical protein
MMREQIENARYGVKPAIVLSFRRIRTDATV